MTISPTAQPTTSSMATIGTSARPRLVTSNANKRERDDR